jgi:hypothetical protein
MPDYSKSQIYTIRFYDNDNLIYIGSTIQPLTVRFSGHKQLLKCSLCQYIQEHYKGDFKCCYIELLEYFKCDNKQELNKREGEIIRKFKEDNKYNVINKYIAGRTRKEHYEDNKTSLNKYHKEYYYNNLQKAKQYNKEYNRINKDILTLKKKERRHAKKEQANKEQEQEHNK